MQPIYNKWIDNLKKAYRKPFQIKRRHIIFKNSQKSKLLKNGYFYENFKHLEKQDKSSH